MRALEIAASGMMAQQMRVEVISQNLANMNTTAYKPRRAEFADLHYQQVVRPGTIAATDGTLIPAGVQMGLGVRASAVSVLIGQGRWPRPAAILTSPSRARAILRSPCRMAAPLSPATARAEADG